MRRILAAMGPDGLERPVDGWSRAPRGDVQQPLRSNCREPDTIPLAYPRTHKTITSPGYWRPLNGSCGLIDLEFYPYQDAGSEVRNGTCVAIQAHRMSEATFALLDRQQRPQARCVVGAT